MRWRIGEADPKVHPPQQHRIVDAKTWGGGTLLYASGGNFVIELEETLAVCRIWSRPDVDREEGARFALAKVDEFKRLLAEPVAVVRSVVIDMTRAPTMWGPVTQSCLERMVAMFETERRRVAVVVGSDPLQSQQMQRLVRCFASRFGMVFDNIAEAIGWARATPIPPRAGGINRE